MSKELRFHHDGTFKIVQFTDLHWKDGAELDLQTRALMQLTIDKEQPDFVMFTGDVIYTGKSPDGASLCENPIQAFREAVSVVEDAKVPWGVVFGNHDTENNITRDELMNEVLAHHYTLAQKGPEQIHGTGNYNLPILSSSSDQAAAILYCLDSGDYPANPHIAGYDWIKHDQIQWYINESNQWKERLNGTILPSLAFFHIPLPEYQTVWDREVCYGSKNENVCASQVQSGFFSAILEQGDVVATFCGHDHINDYWGNLYGVSLHYGRATGVNTYGKEGFPRGARVIRLTEGERTIESWLRLEDGSMITSQIVHQPE